MSDPVVQRILGPIEGSPFTGVGPNRPVEGTPGLYTRVPAAGVADQREPDHMELSSTGQRAYAVFSVHPKTGVVSIKIVDARTDEVIRQIPAEEIIVIAEQAQAYLDAHRLSKVQK
jgi:hypothetical protein